MEELKVGDTVYYMPSYSGKIKEAKISKMKTVIELKGDRYSYNAKNIFKTKEALLEYLFNNVEE